MDIRMPRFMVKAIWPDFVLPAVPVQLPESLYATPYLDVMQAAIMHFGLTAENQGKKGCLLDGFLEQQVEGEPVSNNLADAMATLIRLPSAQRSGAGVWAGSAKRQIGLGRPAAGLSTLGWRGTARSIASSVTRRSVYSSVFAMSTALPAATRS